ncbi:hypothetical protein T4A_6801 [Trichinella pseudospiralis]|uniref:Uncharacterized protein n=1 Tax=Trichinella pseudospiralis TaxID=6337 RepID=A0A0V0XSY4_TRIPS|nr:hypothetical protein T4E_8388 [Trichinella pseudospiralis]KRY71973.1 hypothetical protein T4A_6801 [Trichinella pseudospiralis]KRY83220.1 hypothetical protein T4D_10388 [Trichinella pseudospiralis]KRZ28604.1 hypothetical protein T4C_3149 [Trichinella pseudospiralis]
MPGVSSNRVSLLSTGSTVVKRILNNNDQICQQQNATNCDTDAP